MTMQLSLLHLVHSELKQSYKRQTNRIRGDELTVFLFYTYKITDDVAEFLVVMVGNASNCHRLIQQTGVDDIWK
jgi:hypothetical protein